MAINPATPNASLRSITRLSINRMRCTSLTQSIATQTAMNLARRGYCTAHVKSNQLPIVLAPLPTQIHIATA